MKKYNEIDKKMRVYAIEFGEYVPVIKSCNSVPDLCYCYSEDGYSFYADCENNGYAVAEF